MDNTIIGELEELRCAALADFYLGQVAPKDDIAKELNLTSLDDLYHYLLLDSQVGQELETSRLAEAIACLQQYIGAIYSGLEPGHTTEFSREELIAWHQRYCNISDWAGYQMLLDYPENWINPTMRLRKSDSFKELENNLGQASLSDAAVQMAIFEHLKQFEEVCNLDVISAYINGVDSDDSETPEKGQSFKNSDYYLIGRQRVQPFGYYWRTAHVELKKDSTFLHPAAWTEWKPIGIPASATVLAMRPVYFAGRFMVVQVEGEKSPDRKEKDDNGNEIIVEGTWQVEAKLSYLAVNGIWSTPVSLGKKEFAKASEESARLVVVTYAGARKDVDDLLAVCFTTTDLPAGQMSAAADEKEHGWIFATRNALFEPQVPNIGSLKLLANGRFANQFGLQHQLLSSEVAVIVQTLAAPSNTAAVDDTRLGALSKYLSFNVNFSSRQALEKASSDLSNDFQVQGVCDFNRNVFSLDDIYFGLGKNGTLFHLTKGSLPNTITLECIVSIDGAVLADKYVFCFDDALGKPAIISVFKDSEFGKDGGWYKLKKSVKLSDVQLEILWMARRAQINIGAGFTVRIFDIILPLDGSNTTGQNQIGKGRVSVSRKQESVELVLKILDGEKVVAEWAEPTSLTGWFQTPWIKYNWTGNPVGKKLSVICGENPDGQFGRDRYDIEIKQIPNSSSVPLISKQASGAQFLDMRPLSVKLDWIRLNSLFGPQLVAQAAISIDEILSRSTQDTLEPSPTDAPWTPIDFNSAHGAFYWELFFHLPFLVAHRLCEERNYHESQRWYQYIFNPHIRGEGPSSDRYWLCRPLLEPGNISFEAQGLVDPDAIAFSDRIHYRKAIFMGYVRCIIAHADSLYRRLTRDSLVAAKLQYVRALSLMGAAPSAKAMSHWVPKSADAILKEQLDPESATGTPTLESFARSLDVDVANLPARVKETPDFEIVKLRAFRPFTNDQLLDTWKYIEECLWNMRHNLTIDGKPMRLALYAPPTNPIHLLQAQAGGSSGASRNAGGWLNIPHYRFRTLLATAQNAVQTLIGFGREVRQLMELRDRGLFEELQYSHVIAMGAHAKSIQEETIKQLEASLKGLQQSQAMIQERADHYKGLNGHWLLGLEIGGDAAMLAGKVLGVTAIIPDAVASVTDVAGKDVQLPPLAGRLGGEYGSPIRAVSRGFSIVGAASYALGEALQRAAFYIRRGQEWTFAENQANRELKVMEHQLEAQQHTLNAARASLLQTQKANEQAQEIYTFYKARATNVELYRWLLSQMATLYFQAYDAVVGLCLSAQASWQYEMGDFDTQVIRPNVWMDHRHGLTAGESMLLDLLRLERSFLERNERRLELTKTISLRQLFEQGKYRLLQTWESVLEELENGKLDFEFSQRMFDSDYPGHYCRQITTLSLSLPAVLGPYQDVRATLIQMGSTTVLKPKIESLEYLYGNNASMPPSDVLLNLRSHQVIALSHGVDDSGIYQVNFGDERYLPFEGTGAVSMWRLQFPRSKDSDEQKRLIRSLTDIVVHVRYLAKAGGTAYTEAVLNKLDD